MLVSELTDYAFKRAKASHIDTGKIWLMIYEITGIDRFSFIMHQDFHLSKQQRITFLDWFCRLERHEPLQYILGYTEFYGLRFEVGPAVLIPRPETEGLVNWIAKREQGNLKVMDLGTGSGAIAISLKLLHPEFHLTATDISLPALHLAKRNAQSLKAKVVFHQADLFPAKPQKFDLIISNPPYVAPGEYKILPDEVRWFEPRLALYASRDGLEFYSRIIRQAPHHLKVGGKVYLEIGETQADAIGRLAAAAGFADIEVKQDLAGRDRYLAAKIY